MKIAIQNSWPNLSHSAEKEFVARFRLAAELLGWSIVEVVTSDDIMAASPDAVILTHEFTPKLTAIPTIGIIWSPIAYMVPDEERVRNILSYDGYLVASASLRRWLLGLLEEAGKLAPISEFDFLPSALDSSSPAQVHREQVLFYTGTSWDNTRHKSLFDTLKHRVPLRVYGPPKKWRSIGDRFAGPLPYDGRSVVKAISQCRMALVLHSQDHLREDIPSMRLFESAAAGAVIISDQLPFTQRTFGDTILYVDTRQEQQALVGEIADAVKWIEQHPIESQNKAQSVRSIFQKGFTLEGMLADLPNFIAKVQKSMSLQTGQTADRSVDVVVRIGGRPTSKVERAISSVAIQTHKKVGLVLVSYRPVEGIDVLLKRFEGDFSHITILRAPDDGIRSTPLWMGLTASDADYVCNLDDDDTIHPDHLASLIETLENAPGLHFAYAGTVQTQEEDGFWYFQPNFKGDLKNEIRERRRLRFLDPFSSERLLQLDNYIQSNAWLARRSALTDILRYDPRLVVGEDLYLYIMLLQHGPFAASWRPTAVWNWRSSARDNVMFSLEEWGKIQPQLRQKLADQGIALTTASEGLAPLGLRHVRMGIRATKKLVSEPQSFLGRVRLASSLLIHDGPSGLLAQMRRFGKR